MLSGIGFPTSGAFLNQKPNILGSRCISFCTSSGKRQLKPLQDGKKLCQLHLSVTSFQMLHKFSAWTDLSNFDQSEHTMYRFSLGFVSLIYIVYSNIKSCNAKRRRPRKQPKKFVGLISQKKKKNFARAAHFLVHFFAVVLHDYNDKIPETSRNFLVRRVMCSCSLCFRCSSFSL